MWTKGFANQRANETPPSRRARGLHRGLMDAGGRGISDTGIETEKDLIDHAFLTAKGVPERRRTPHSFTLGQERVPTAPKVLHSLGGGGLSGAEGGGRPSTSPGSRGSLERPSPDSMSDARPPSAARRQGPESIIPQRLSGLRRPPGLCHGEGGQPTSAQGPGRLEDVTARARRAGPTPAL